MRGARRKRLPTAYELVYDNYNFFVIGYGLIERPSDAILSLTGGAIGVGLCFIHGASLPDPEDPAATGKPDALHSRRLGRGPGPARRSTRSSRP
jgi:hypothetical protein